MEYVILPRLRRGTRKYEKAKEAARALALARLSHWNSSYNHEYRRVFIRKQRTIWGTCSARKNLSFNYRIVFLPPHLIDYVIVHELCHLAQLNHSPAFWALVGRAIPNHRELRKELRSRYRF